MPDGQMKTDNQQSTAAAIKPSLYTVLVPLTGARYLAYNTVSQSFSVWDEQDMALWQDLSANESLPYSAGYRGFVQGGYVVNANIDEREAVRSTYDRARNSDSHMMMTIAPTLSCNFGCHYCFQGQDKPLSRMTEKVREAFKPVEAVVLDDDAGDRDPDRVHQDRDRGGREQKDCLVPHRTAIEHREDVGE